MIVNHTKDGVNGITPHIGENGNWFFNNDDTGVRAKGQSNTEIVEVILPLIGWSEDTLSQTVECQGVLADESKQMITIIPAHDYKDKYKAYGIECTNCSSNSLDFSTNMIPTEDIKIYVALDAIGDTKPTNTYSTEEQVVGTWIDGKPIYRKVITNDITVTGPSSTKYIDDPNFKIDVSDLCIDTFLNTVATAVNDEYELKYVVPNAIMCIQIFENNLIFTLTNTGLTYDVKYIVIEYTKTTDTATVEV